jgi:hypothetical protein
MDLRFYRKKEFNGLAQTRHRDESRIDFLFKPLWMRGTVHNKMPQDNY